ncbi:MAG TPA: peptidoglycan-binding domain-containing protein [Acidobacteriota bacterium]|nr:peptidoglycan-binding domain-containing protein [Acidobacteriota bacterium]
MKRIQTTIHKQSYFQTLLAAVMIGLLALCGTALADHDDGDLDAELIKNVQQTLNQKGFEAGPVDGIMGPKTQSGLREFQSAEGLEVTGRINGKTLDKLGIDHDEQSEGLLEKAGEGLASAGKAVGKATATAAKATAKGTKKAAKATAKATTTAAKKTAQGAKATGEATAEGASTAAEATAEGTSEAAEATAEGAETAAKATKQGVVEGSEEAADESEELLLGEDQDGQIEERIKSALKRTPWSTANGLMLRWKTES